MVNVKCIFWLRRGFCALLKQCKCFKINEQSYFSFDINEDDYNPFREKL
jgi:hypothetical protein